MQPVCGVLIDTFGLKIAFAGFALAWSLANMAHGFANGWLSLAFFRGLLGVSEAGAVPAGIKAVGEWFVAKDRSIAVGFFNAGTSLGALIAPPVVIWLSLAHGWRAAFVATGAIGLVWAVAWYVLYDTPSRHPALSPAERAEAKLRLEARTAEKPTRALELIRQRRFWAIAIPRFLSEPAWQTFSFWIPLFLSNERHMDIKQIALFAWLPFLAADAGGILGGYFSPFLMRMRVGLLTSRAIGVAIGGVMMIAPACVGLVAGPYAAIALFCVGGFAHQAISVLLNTLTADVFPQESVGRANGLVGMAGWTGGLLFSLLIGAFADTVGFGPLFGLLGVFDVLGAIVLFALLRPAQRDATAS
jgi:ACS family hexuronate transporter-like MFS transporter